MNDIVSIIPHTEKSFVVFTNKVSKYEETLTNFGGLFHNSLINKNTGETIQGWIFYINKIEEIQKWINEGCIVVRKNQSQSFEKILFPPKKNKKVPLSPVNIYNQEERIKPIEKMIENLITKVNLLEQENSLLKNRINSIENELNLLKSEKKQKTETEEEYEIIIEN